MWTDWIQKSALLGCLYLGAAAGPAQAEMVLIHANHGKVHARVDSSIASRFVAFIKDFEAAGGIVRFMGGYRPGRCHIASLHPCGRAIDICQYRRNVVDQRCHFPANVTAMASRHGLLHGAVWHHADRGHIEYRRVR